MGLLVLPCLILWALVKVLPPWTEHKGPLEQNLSASHGDD